MKVDGPAENSGQVRSMLTFDDLSHDLVWPRLLRAGVLAFHPARLMVSLVLVGLMSLVLWVLWMIEDAAGWIGAFADGEKLALMLDRWWTTPGTVGWGHRLVATFIELPLLFVGVHPLVGLVGVPACVVMAAIAHAAISRSAATEFTGGKTTPMIGSVRFAAGRIGSILCAILGPLILIWLIALMLAAGGAIFASVPGLNLVGALLYGAAVLAAVVAVFLMFVYVLGKPLLIPAVCCDGADAIDAIQRAYSYVLARPLRLALYVGILVVQGFLLLAVVSSLAAAVIMFASGMAGAFATVEGKQMLNGVASGAADGSLSQDTFNAAAAIVRGWRYIPGVLPIAFLFSYIVCACTVLYLGMRRVCDGQDMNELWSPEEDRASALGSGAAAIDTDADAE